MSPTLSKHTYCGKIVYYEFHITEYPNPYFVGSEEDLDGEMNSLKSEQAWWLNNNNKFHFNSYLFAC
jgi:hypothetical protein